LLLLYGIKNKISFPIKYKQADASEIIELGLVVYKEGPMYSLTEKGKRMCAKYDNYFNVSKKRTNKQLMGKDYNKMLKMYREAFPKGKLPSGKPGRQNVKTLENAFRLYLGRSMSCYYIICSLL
jgi:hypothetical protein